MILETIKKMNHYLQPILLKNLDPKKKNVKMDIGINKI